MGQQKRKKKQTKGGEKKCCRDDSFCWGVFANDGCKWQSVGGPTAFFHSAAAAVLAAGRASTWAGCQSGGWAEGWCQWWTSDHNRGHHTLQPLIESQTPITPLRSTAVWLARGADRLHAFIVKENLTAPSRRGKQRLYLLLGVDVNHKLFCVICNKCVFAATFARIKSD